MRATASDDTARRRARIGFVAASQARPSGEAAPPPKGGRGPPARTQAPASDRASTIEPVPASTSRPARSPMAPRYAASTSDSTCTRRARPPSRRTAARRSLGVHTPRVATTRCSTLGARSRRRRQRARRLAAMSRVARLVTVQRCPAPFSARTRSHVPPASTPTVHVRAMAGIFSRRTAARQPIVASFREHHIRAKLSARLLESPRREGGPMLNLILSVLLASTAAGGGPTETVQNAVKQVFFQEGGTEIKKVSTSERRADIRRVAESLF